MLKPQLDLPERTTSEGNAELQEGNTYMSEDRFKFFQNKQCEYFPCHKGIKAEEFNCLFCFCPLYPLGEKCGGNFKYIENDVKDCSGCTLPHRPGAYEFVCSKWDEIKELAAANRKDPEENKDK